jgi:poly(ribitol-phosphate) beta-N-acetylglucosaminyltransferase
VTIDELVVSVIVPVYNVELYLGQCLDAIFGQTMSKNEYEVLAVNDGSTDGSLAILQSYASANQNLRVFTIPNSGSAGEPRNVGLLHARGRYVFFVDADDLIAPMTLTSMARVGDETGSDVILCRSENHGEGTRPTPRSMFTRDHFAEDFVESLAYRTLSALKMFRRSLIEKHCIRFPTDYRIGEDLPFTMKAYLVGNHVSILSDQPYYYVRTREDGKSTTQLGQSPWDNMTKNLNVIKVVEQYTSPGPRRDILLARSFTARAGLGVSFHLGFAELDRCAQEALVDRAAGVAHLWTDGLRKLADTEATVTLDLLFAKNIDELVRVSKLVGTERPLPLQLTADGRSFVYIAANGFTVRDVPSRLSASLDDLQVAGRLVRLGGWLSGWGVSQAPEEVNLIWRLKRSTQEMSFPSSCEKMPMVQSEQESTFQWTCIIEVGALVKRGTWDAYLEARWGDVAMRVRLGSRSTARNEAAIALGIASRAALLFTRYDNLSLDVGVKRTYKSLEYMNRVVKLMPTKRGTVLVIEGPIEDSTRLEVEQARRAGSKTTSALVESLNPVTHVAEPSIQIRSGTYQFALEGPSGRTVLTTGEQVAPPALRVTNGPEGKIYVAKRRRGTARSLLRAARAKLLLSDTSRSRAASE